jgi:YVTN family beta-propeller protein
MLRPRVFCALIVGGLTASALLLSCQSAPPSNQDPPPTPLSTGKIIPTDLHVTQNVGNLPMNLAISPDGRYAVTCDMGYHQSLWSIRMSDGVGISQVGFSNTRPGPAANATAQASGSGEATLDVPESGSYKANSVYYGLAISRDGTVYAAQGQHDTVAELSLDADGKITLIGSIPTRAKDFPAGLALDDRGLLYVANNASANAENPFTLSGSMAVYDPAKKKELGRYVFSDSYGGTSNFPLGVAVLRDGSKAYVAAERDDAVYIIDTHDPAALTLRAKVPTGAHPVAVLASADQQRVYVANSLGDTVSVIDARSDRVIGTVLLRPAMALDVPGVTPVGLALSADQKTLFVALADMNAIAIVDTGTLESRGYVPAGWYPTSIAVMRDGDLLVANAKGTLARNPNNRVDPHNPALKTARILSVLEGNLIQIHVPTGKDLQEASDQVINYNHLDELARPTPNPLAGIGLASGKIKHVIYIIKENRTYDQVLGDMPQGNGDASLAMFGRTVTPNQHALAERFVLLDNLYASGEVSGDGWCWSTQGMEAAYVARNIPYMYSHRGRKYDFEGQNNGYITGGFPATAPDGKPTIESGQFRNGAKPIPDVAGTNRHFWDSAAQAGLSMRNYGFFLSFDTPAEGLKSMPDNYPTVQGLQPPGHDLAGVSDIDYRRFDLDYPDSDAPAIFTRQGGGKSCLFAKTAYGAHDMPSRFSEWNREFQMMLAKSPDGSAVPTLLMVRLMMDHTHGASSGKHTPRSCAADNDYAVGQLVAAVSHSPIWSSTAIFVIEDDAQNGVDHVDAHRTTGFIISPWIKANSVDHHFYNTDSFLKTMELLLGMKPLSQFDLVAGPVLDWDTSPANAQPYDAVMPPREIIGEMNPRAKDLHAGDPRLQMAMQSDAMDFVHPDAAPAQELNQIIWKTVNGPSSKMPAPRGVSSKDDDDDDD